jgi:hypothetical protein
VIAQRSTFSSIITSIIFISSFEVPSMHRSPIQSISQLSRDISIPQAYLIKILQQIHDPPSHLFLSQSRARCIASHRRYRCGRVCYSRGDEGGSDSSPYGRLRCSCAGLREASCGSKESGAEHLVGVDDGRRVLEICLNYSSFSENIGLEALLRNGNSRDLGAWTTLSDDFSLDRRTF